MYAACTNARVWCVSEVRLPEGGRLTLYAPAATRNLTRCAHSCYSFTSADAHAGALTTPMIDGALLAAVSCAFYVHCMLDALCAASSPPACQGSAELTKRQLVAPVITL